MFGFLALAFSPLAYIPASEEKDSSNHYVIYFTGKLNIFLLSGFTEPNIDCPG